MASPNVNPETINTKIETLQNLLEGTGKASYVNATLININAQDMQTIVDGLEPQSLDQLKKTSENIGNTNLKEAVKNVVEAAEKEQRLNNPDLIEAAQQLRNAVDAQDFSLFNKKYNLTILQENLVAVKYDPKELIEAAGRLAETDKEGPTLNEIVKDITTAANNDNYFGEKPTAAMVKAAREFKEEKAQELGTNTTIQSVSGNAAEVAAGRTT